MLKIKMWKIERGMERPENHWKTDSVEIVSEYSELSKI